jgi:hypothetical protein
MSASSVRADDAGWVLLFNGKDLSNWVNVNCAPGTWTVGNGVIKCTGKPTGALRTPRQYENFILELDWRHLRPAGNSGVFVWGSAIAAPGVPFLRAIEVQVLDNAFNIPGKNRWYTTHGDVFPIHGATMKPIHKGDGMRCFPSEERSKSSPEWNHYRIVGQNGTIRLSVNGKEVSGGDDVVWRKGYLALESEGSPVEFRNLRLKELPSSGATPEQSAPKDEGWRPLYTGVDLHGWKADGELQNQWTPDDWRLRCVAAAGILWTQAEWGNVELIVDVRASKNSSGKTPAASLALPFNHGTFRQAFFVRPGSWTRNHVTIRGNELTMQNSDREPQVVEVRAKFLASHSIGLVGNSAVPVEFGNIYIRSLK